MGVVDLRSTAAEDLPSRLASLHWTVAPGDRARAWLPPPETLDRRRLDDVLEGAGFCIVRREATRPTRLTRCWTLPDTVAPNLRVLICGLNPSPAAADAGVGFARPGNRFWPAAMRAGLVTVDRDPHHALDHHGVGMTDVVKRTTRRADELSDTEYRAGLARLERTVAWLGPLVVCFVGLAGWRSARDRHAVPGWQPEPLGGRPTYVMPSTSGLNASADLPSLADHLRAAMHPPPES